MVGRSNIVGLPVSLFLLKENATVTIVHSRTKEPEKIVREADIIIAAAGQAMMVTRSIHFSLLTLLEASFLNILLLLVNSLFTIPLQ